MPVAKQQKHRPHAPITKRWSTKSATTEYSLPLSLALSPLCGAFSTKTGKPTLIALGNNGTKPTCHSTWTLNTVSSTNKESITIGSYSPTQSTSYTAKQQPRPPHLTTKHKQKHSRQKQAAAAHPKNLKPNTQWVPLRHTRTPGNIASRKQYNWLARASRLCKLWDLPHLNQQQQLEKQQLGRKLRLANTGATQKQWLQAQIQSNKQSLNTKPPTKSTTYNNGSITCAMTQQRDTNGSTRGATQPLCPR